MKWLVVPLVSLFLMASGTAFAQGSPTAVVKKTVDEVIRIVSDKELKKPQNEPKRRQGLKKAIGAVFDYNEMAQRSLARHWKERSAAEKKEFTELFETLLENSYADKIESYNQEKVLYGKEIVEGDSAEVRSRIVTAKRDEYSLDYRLLKKGGMWMAYDVVIEGVSLVANYRTQFNKIITSEGYPALVKKLRAKSEEIKAP